MTRVGAVIVSYNSAGELVKCIESVAAQNSSDLSAVSVVVDNNSTDDSVKLARKSGAVVIANDKNLGFSKAVNIGINKSYELGCNIVLVLNPDAIMGKGALEAMISALNRGGSDIAAVGPLMTHGDGTPANEGYYLKAPSLLTVTFFSTLLRPWSLKRKFLVSKYEEQDLVEEREVEQIPGACLIARKDTLSDIGLLDEDFAIWFEDVEWSYRARKKGYRLLFCPAAHVIHEGGVSFSKWEGLEKSVTFYVSMKTFFRKHKPFVYPLVVLVLCVNAFASYLKGRDKNQLRFIKRFVTQKRGVLPN